MSTIKTPSRNRPARSVKRPANLSLSSDVLDAARQLDINVSQVCDEYLRTYVQRAQAQQWRQDHAAFVEAYNATLAAEGLPLDEWKSF